MAEDQDIQLPGRIDNVSLMFPSQYLAQGDLHGQDWTATIERVVLRDLQIVGTSKKLRKAVVHFRENLPDGTQKAWVLNKTNALIIAEIHDQPDPHKWGGLRITLWPDPDVMMKGKRVGGIRVRARKPSGNAPSTGNEDADYLKAFADAELVKALRREMFGDRRKLTAAEIKQLADAVRKQDPDSREPGDETDETSF